MGNSFAPLLILAVLIWTKAVHGFELGSCSRSCHQNSDRRLEYGIPLHECYCSPGCSKLGDCCFDYENRTQGPFVPTSQVMYFSVKGKGSYRAIAECPEGISCLNVSLPLVTSLLTNLTYANRICAECHGDSDDLIAWDARLKCCKGRNLNGVSLDHRGIHGFKGLVQKRGEQYYCRCRYAMSDEAFLKVVRLDLRPYYFDFEFESRCVNWWKDDSECPSYVDPVFVRNRIYRNIDCATCNNERSADLEGAVCVSQQLYMDSGVLQICRKKGIVSCAKRIDPSIFSESHSQKGVHQVDPSVFSPPSSIEGQDLSMSLFYLMPLKGNGVKGLFKTGNGTIAICNFGKIKRVCRE